jgi:ADP-heptose:LPS heptosyltransferase
MSEQLRLKSRTEVPNGGWRFFQAETVWKAPFTLSDTFDVAVRKIIYHRMGNARFNLPTDYEAVALELEDQTARSLISRNMGEQYVQGAEKKTTTLEHQSILHRAQAAVAGLVDDIRKDAVGAASLAEWIGSGSLPVPQAQADERAAVCLSCPLNQTKRGRLKEAVASAIQSYTQVKSKLGLRAKGEADLKTCAACECPLRLKVWVPLKYILSHTDVGIFPDNCWVKKEHKAPPVPSAVLQPKPLITIQRASAFGDVITATALASRIKAHGYNVRFATHKDIMPVLAGHPDIAETVEVGTVRPDINLDGAYEAHPDRKHRSIASLFEEAARKQIRNPERVLGENGHYEPLLVVPDDEKASILKTFSVFKKPWVVIVPKSGQWKNRSVPDDTWLKTAALVEGTCFWTGYERIGSPIVDLGTRNFRRVMAAVACADLVVTVDTGPMHVASALKKPILAIQQAFDLSLRLPKGGNWTSFSPDLDCLKCCEFHCPINKDNPPCTFLDHELLAKAINLRTSNAIIPEQKPVVIAPGVPVPPEAVVPKLAKIVHYVVVVLTVFKRHQHIDAAIKSIRNAGFTEAIVITAGGITPELEEVLKRHEATGVIVVRNAEGTTNTDQWIAGCKYAQRRLVILFHDDDLMLPGYADALFPLLTGEAEYSISNAAGHGSPTAGPSDIAILKPGVSNSRMLEDTLMRLERTLSPIQGCFPRDLVISSLEEWKTKHSDDKRFEAWPGFEVGNDLYLWLKASSSLKKCLVLSKRYDGCQHRGWHTAVRDHVRSGPEDPQAARHSTVSSHLLRPRLVNRFRVPA